MKNSVGDFECVKDRMSAWYRKELCSCCEANILRESCNKCGSGVCESVECSVIFPHYHNSRYIICMGCNNGITANLHILIDYEKLSLLKVKIERNRKKV